MHYRGRDDVVARQKIVGGGDFLRVRVGKLFDASLAGHVDMCDAIEERRDGVFAGGCSFTLEVSDLILCGCAFLVGGERELRRLPNWD